MKLNNCCARPKRGQRGNVGLRRHTRLRRAAVREARAQARALGNGYSHCNPCHSRTQMWNDWVWGHNWNSPHNWSPFGHDRWGHNDYGWNDYGWNYNNRWNDWNCGHYNANHARRANASCVNSRTPVGVHPASKAGHVVCSDRFGLVQGKANPEVVFPVRRLRRQDPLAVVNRKGLGVNPPFAHPGLLHLNGKAATKEVGMNVFFNVHTSTVWTLIILFESVLAKKQRAKARQREKEK